ncbi:methyltransferase-like protein 24 [Pollicipes pollicipes]|uniref:methyltransferase-like protein 24 n=1 Tax=Pollicipes pollicipes TaxID=41117 RepID=UPI001884A987|nr:methyltransferase-like protein 24 [Pollicipes pollicipes]
MAGTWAHVKRRWTPLFGRLLLTGVVAGLLVVAHLSRHQAVSGWPRASPLDQTPTRTAELLAALYQYLETPEPCCRRLQRFGGAANGDGDKLVCMDAALRPPPGRCLVYSVGVANDWSFDRAMVEHGCEVHSFDPTVGRPDGPTEFGGHFHAVGLTGDNSSAQQPMRMATLAQLRAQLGHQRRDIDYLKVDIEGNEWSWLDGEELEVFKHVRQLGMEVHFLDLEHSPSSYEPVLWYFETFQFLREQGFCLVSATENVVVPKRLSLPGMTEKKALLFEMVWVKSK